MLVAQRIFERLPQRQADVFNRVMIVDFEVALGLDLDVEKTVAAKGIEHVIEKRHAGFNGRLSGAVDIQRHLDIGLFGFPLDLRCTSHGYLPCVTRIRVDHGA